MKRIADFFFMFLAIFMAGAALMYFQTAPVPQNSNFAVQFFPTYSTLTPSPTVTPTATAFTADLLPLAKPSVENFQVGEIAQPEIQVIQPVLQADLSVAQVVLVADTPTITIYNTVEGLNPANMVFVATTKQLETPIAPVSWDIDDLWDAVATPGSPAWADSLPLCPFPLPVPFIDWSMAAETSLLDDQNSETILLPASEISRIAARGGISFPSEGWVAMPESGIIPALIPFLGNGSIQMCKDTNDYNRHPNFYGPGSQDFFNSLQIQ